MSPEPVQARISGQCAVCQTPFAPGEKAVVCPSCRAPYHPECWQENRGCAIYGCPKAPPTEKRLDLELPVSYWGRERKPCPRCGQEILASAVRCRHCGALFDSAKPMDRTEFRSSQRVKDKLPGIRKAAVWLFVFCLIPCTAPIAVIICLAWYFANSREIPRLPALHQALAKLALIIGFGVTGLLILFVILFAIVRQR